MVGSIVIAINPQSSLKSYDFTSLPSNFNNLYSGLSPLNKKKIYDSTVIENLRLEYVWKVYRFYIWRRIEKILNLLNLKAIKDEFQRVLDNQDYNMELHVDSEKPFYLKKVVHKQNEKVSHQPITSSIKQKKSKIDENMIETRDSTIPHSKPKNRCLTTPMDFTNYYFDFLRLKTPLPL